MLSDRRWNFEAVIFLAGGILFSWSLTTLLSLVLGPLLQAQDPTAPGFHQFVLSTLGFHAVALVLMNQFLKLHATGWREFLGLAGPRWRRALVVGVIAGVLILPVALGLNKSAAWLLEQVQMTPIEQRTVRILKVSVGVGQRICFAAGAIVLAPLVEEMLFRGVLYPALKQRVRPALAATFTALLFAAIHFNVMTFVPLTFIGLALVWVYERTDNLLAPIVAHAFFNATNFLIMVNE
jgi:hypothetical protein